MRAKTPRKARPMFPIQSVQWETVIDNEDVAATDRLLSFAKFHIVAIACSPSGQKIVLMVSQIINNNGQIRYCAITEVVDKDPTTTIIASFETVVTLNRDLLPFS